VSKGRGRAESDNAETAVRSFRFGRGFFTFGWPSIEQQSLYRKICVQKRRGITGEDRLKSVLLAGLPSFSG